MESTKFGSMILNFLSVNAQNELPVTEVQEAIATVVDEIQNRQAEQDAANDSNQALCDEQITRFNNQIASETEIVTSIGNSIVSNEELLDQAKRDLELAASDLDETVAALESGNAQREAEHARWVDVDYEHTTAIVSIDESIKLIKHMIHGVTFAQIKPRYEKVQESLKKSNKFATLFKPLIVSLSELATKLNYENVVAILDLLNNIQTSLEDSQKASLSDKKSRLNALITSTVEIIAQSRNSLSFHQNSLVKAEANLEDQTNWCELVTETYTNETNER
jgi:uncharacterized small protein (DUF1192 family)